MYDLPHINEGRPEEYTLFYTAAKGFIERHALVVADERRYSEVCHLALATSVRDFRDQVAQTLPQVTPTPSIEALR